jgi:hypothetical protein
MSFGPPVLGNNANPWKTLDLYGLNREVIGDGDLNHNQVAWSCIDVHMDKKLQDG